MAAALMRRGHNRPRSAHLLEAAAAMAGAAGALRLFPFRRIVTRLADPPAVTHTEPDEVEQIRRAIDAWTRRLPVTPKCFVRGLAAHWMLRRRGLASTLYYGAANIDGVLKAHVWVRSGEIDVVGCENAGNYALLASFPDR